MAITIQDLIASDTISQAVDKINFNFDQLLLNGGGPVGPSGPQGTPGPIGGRGERGSDWYDGTVNPNTIIVSPSLLPGDYYLQSDGQVWEYNGTTWFTTPVNLTGPTGTPGTSDGWLYIGNDGSGNVIPANKNTLYPSGMPGGAGANASNEGVAMVLVGGVTTQTPTVGYSYSAAYELTDDMTASLDSSRVSMLIHQKNTSARAIKFMGGNALPENFEQDNLGNLAEIYLGADDVLNINIPKVTTPTSTSSAIGFNLYSGPRGMNFRSGRGIKYVTGGIGSGSGAYDIADYEIEINEVNAALPPAFSVNILGNKSGLFQLGQTTPPTTNTFNGLAYLGADEILIDGRTSIEFNSDATTYTFKGLSSISLAPEGLVAYTAGESLTKIRFSGGAVPVGQISYNSLTSNLEGSTGTDNYLASWDIYNRLQNQNWIMSGDAIYPNQTNTQKLGSTYGGCINALHLSGGASTGNSLLSFYDDLGTYNRNVLQISGANSPTTGIVRFVPGNELSFQPPLTGTSRSNTNTQFQLNLTFAEANDGGNAGSWYQGKLPGTVMVIGSRAVNGKQRNGTTSTINYGKIEISPKTNSGGQCTGKEMAGIWARPEETSTTAGGTTNNYWQNKPIVFKGSDGSETTTSGSRHYGGGAAVLGGDGGNTSGQAGWVTLSPGGQNQLVATEYAKGVQIGYNPYYDLPNFTSTSEENATRRSAAQVTIGPPLTMNSTSWGPNYKKDEIFLKIHQPPSIINIGNTDEERRTESRYVMMVKSCYADADSAGAVAFYNRNNSNGLEFYPHLGSNDFNPHVEEGDTLIMHMNNGTNGNVQVGAGEGGLVIGAKDGYWGAMRINQGGDYDGRVVNNPSEPKLQFYGHGNYSSVDDFQDLGFQVRSINSIVDHPDVLSCDSTRSIFASGWMKGKQAGGIAINVNNSYIHWQRIGNTISCHGNIQFGNGTGQRIVYLPVLGTSGGANLVRGHCDIVKGVSLDDVTGHVVQVGSNRFSFRRNGAWVNLANSNVHFSFAYIML